MKNKEKIVRDLVNTFNDRDALHIAYKRKMKEILTILVWALSEESAKNQNVDINEFIDNFVETHFKPSE